MGVGGWVPKRRDREGRGRNVGEIQGRFRNQSGPIRVSEGEDGRWVKSQRNMRASTG